MSADQDGGGRIPTHLWVHSHLRLFSAAGTPAYVLRKGEAHDGMVVLKVTVPFQGAKLFTQSRDLEGNPCWIAGGSGALLSEEEATAYIERQLKRDPDLWVIEVESRTGDNPFKGSLL